MVTIGRLMGPIAPNRFTETEGSAKGCFKPRKDGIGGIS